jgi:hypothetical protein
MRIGKRKRVIGIGSTTMATVRTIGHTLTTVRTTTIPTTILTTISPTTGQALASRLGSKRALPIDPDNRLRFDLMGLERVRIALLRGFDLPRGPMREDALDWVAEQEDRQESRQRIILIATIMAAVGAWIAALTLLSGWF